MVGFLLCIGAVQSNAKSSYLPPGSYDGESLLYGSFTKTTIVLHSGCTIEDVEKFPPMEQNATFVNYDGDELLVIESTGKAYRKGQITEKTKLQRMSQSHEFTLETTNSNARLIASDGYYTESFGATLKGGNESVPLIGTAGGGFVRADNDLINKIENQTNDSALNLSLNPFSISKLQEFIASNPNSEYTKFVSGLIQDEQIIAAIKRSNAAGYQTVSLEMLHDGLFKAAVLNNNEKGRTSFLINGNRYLVNSIIGRQKSGIFTPDMVTATVPPCGDGSVFVFRGGDHFIAELNGFVGELQDPLRLVFIENVGFVYLGGKGKMFAPDGSIQIEFDSQNPSVANNLSAELELEKIVGGFKYTGYAPNKTTNDSSLNLALNPFSLSKLQEYSSKNQQYPVYSKFTYGIVQDENKIAAITNGNTTGLKILTPEMIGDGPIKRAINTNRIKGRVSFVIYPDGSEISCLFGGLKKVINSTNMQTTYIPPCGSGSVFVFIGGDKFIPNLHGFVGDYQKPLRIAYIENVGFVYLGGKGKKYSSDGTVQFEFTPSGLMDTADVSAEVELERVLDKLSNKSNPVSTNIHQNGIELPFVRQIDSKNNRLQFTLVDAVATTAYSGFFKNMNFSSTFLEFSYVSRSGFGVGLSTVAYDNKDKAYMPFTEILTTRKSSGVDNVDTVVALHRYRGWRWLSPQLTYYPIFTDKSSIGIIGRYDWLAPRKSETDIALGKFRLWERVADLGLEFRRNGEHFYAAIKTGIDYRWILASSENQKYSEDQVINLDRQFSKRLYISAGIGFGVYNPREGDRCKTGLGYYKQICDNISDKRAYNKVLNKSIKADRIWQKTNQNNLDSVTAFLNKYKPSMQSAQLLSVNEKLLDLFGRDLKNNQLYLAFSGSYATQFTQLAAGHGIKSTLGCDTLAIAIKKETLSSERNIRKLILNGAQITKQEKLIATVSFSKDGTTIPLFQVVGLISLYFKTNEDYKNDTFEIKTEDFERIYMELLNKFDSTRPKLTKR